MNTKNKETKKQFAIHGVMWRFSLILLIPIMILLYVTYMPVKWLFTGKFRFSQGINAKWYEVMIHKWLLKVGL